MKINSFLIVFLFLCYNLSAQLLSVSDNSERTKKNYLNAINRNKEIVLFIESELEKKGLPKHLRNLALIESHFDRNTVSTAGAKGIWQFMIPHANQYGLTSEDRSDIYKSTKVAMISLINLYNKYNNWITVVASYNCGEENVNRAMRKANSTKYTDFYMYLPRETQNHVQKYINASNATGELNEVLNDYYKQGGPVKANFNTNAESYVVQKINSAYDLDVIAKFLNITKEQIIEWNSTIVDDLEKQTEVDLYLPNDYMTIFLLNQQEILKESL